MKRTPKVPFQDRLKSVVFPTFKYFLFEKISSEFLDDDLIIANAGDYCIGIHTCFFRNVTIWCIGPSEQISDQTPKKCAGARSADLTLVSLLLTFYRDLLFSTAAKNLLKYKKMSKPLSKVLLQFVFW